MKFPDLLPHGQARQAGVHLRAVVQIQDVPPIDCRHLGKHVGTPSLSLLICKVGMVITVPILLGRWQD